MTLEAASWACAGSWDQQARPPDIPVKPSLPSAGRPGPTAEQVGPREGVIPGEDKPEARGQRPAFHLACPSQGTQDLNPYSFILGQVKGPFFRITEKADC